MNPDGVKAQVTGNSGANDLSAVGSDKDGSNLSGKGGDDILRGGKYDDLLTGGQGDDKMFGGMGSDVFRFFGTIPTGSNGDNPIGVETDAIYDLAFRVFESDALIGSQLAPGATGIKNDKLLFQNFTETSANGTLDSYEDIVNIVANSGWEASGFSNNNNLKLTYDFGDESGLVQNIIITNGFSQYMAAMGEGGGGESPAA